MQPIQLFIPFEEVSTTEFISMIDPLILEEKSISKHLYVKQHSITKLLYFGVTVQDPIKYKGSGTHWKRHYRKHGKEFINTLCVWTFNCQSDATDFALKFSELNDIVKSKDWANEITENGLCGGSEKGRKLSEETKKKMSDAHKGKKHTDIRKQNIKNGLNNRSIEDKENHSQCLSNALKGKHKSDTHKQKLIITHTGVSLSDSHKQSISDAYNNIPDEKKLIINQNRSISHQNRSPEEKKLTREKQSNIHKGLKLYDKIGEKSKYFSKQPDDIAWVPRQL